MFQHDSMLLEGSKVVQDATLIYRADKWLQNEMNILM